MLSSRFSALACSSRSAMSASRRWPANRASSVNTIVPPTVTLRASMVLVNHSGTAGDTPPSSSPARRGSDVAEDERPERGQDPPKTDPAGVEEAPQRDHRQRGSEQDGDLADTKERAEVACAREDDERRQQDREVRERHPAHRRPEREVQGRPQQRDRQDQHRDQHEKRLAGARVGVVLRIRADSRQTRQRPIGHTHEALAFRERSGARHSASCRRCSSVSNVCSGCGGNACSIRRPPHRTYTTGMIVPSASYSTATAQASPPSRSTKSERGTIPSSRIPSAPSTSTTRARYPFCVQSSGARASSLSRCGTTSSRSSSRPSRLSPKCLSAMCCARTRAL